MTGIVYGGDIQFSPTDKPLGVVPARWLPCRSLWDELHVCLDALFCPHVAEKLQPRLISAIAGRISVQDEDVQVLQILKSTEGPFPFPWPTFGFTETLVTTVLKP